MPETPSEDFSQIHVSDAEVIWPSGYGSFHFFGGLFLGFELRSKVGACRCILCPSTFFLSLRKSSKAGEMPAPELVSLDVHFVPRWVTNDHVESRTIAEEDLGKSDREVKRIHAVCDFMGMVRIHLEQFFNGENFG